MLLWIEKVCLIWMGNEVSCKEWIKFRMEEGGYFMLILTKKNNTITLQENLKDAIDGKHWKKPKVTSENAVGSLWAPKPCWGLWFDILDNGELLSILRDVT